MIEWTKNKRPENLSVDLIILPAKNNKQITDRCDRLNINKLGKQIITESFNGGAKEIPVSIRGKKVLFLRIDTPESKMCYRSTINRIRSYCEDKIIFSCSFPILMGHNVQLQYAEKIVDKQLFTSTTLFYVCEPNNFRII